MSLLLRRVAVKSAFTRKGGNRRRHRSQVCRRVAETELSGEWTPRYHQDLPERIPGPALGEYHGIPINDAARRRAESWSASILSVLEHQCVPHPADYATRGPSHMRIWKEVDRDTQQLVAIRMRISAWGTERAIWMDGRARPPPYAAHTCCASISSVAALTSPTSA